MPWTNAAISGWVLDPDRKKMSKSKGNVVTPLALLQEYGSDGVRYWAARGGPGVDTAFDVGQMKIGRKLAMKVLNVSKFVLAGRAGRRRGHRAARPRHAAEPAGARRRGDAELEHYEYAKALAKIESFFWDFCDNYVEAAKSRRYGDFGGEAAASASTAMRLALSVLLRLLAPYLSFACEEVWSWTNAGSIHRAAWPTRDEIIRVSGTDASAQRAVFHVTEALNVIRKGKVDQKVSIGTPVREVVYQSTDEAIACLKLVERDLKAASRADALVLRAGAEPGSDHVEARRGVTDESTHRSPGEGGLTPRCIATSCARRLTEDRGRGDATSAATIAADQRARGTILAKSDLVVAGHRRGCREPSGKSIHPASFEVRWGDGSRVQRGRSRRAGARPTRGRCSKRNAPR